MTGERKFVIKLLLPFQKESDKITIPESAVCQRIGFAYSRGLGRKERELL